MAKNQEWNRSENASEQLNRVLEFFPRVDAKVSALFAIDTAMLALLATNAKPEHASIWYIVLLNVVAGGAVAASLYFLYYASFPQLKGGAKSLVYFREIASMTEVNFVEAMRECDEERYTTDLLGQVWRNSEILTLKFDALKHAFWCTAIALLPWLGALLSATLSHSPLVVK